MAKNNDQSTGYEIGHIASLGGQVGGDLPPEIGGFLARLFGFEVSNNEQSKEPQSSEKKEKK